MKRKMLVALFMIATFLAEPAPPLRADDADKKCDEAGKALNAGLLVDAQRILEQVLRKKPGYPRARVLLGLTHADLAREAEKGGHWDRAAAEYSEALALDGDEPYWHAALAQALDAQGDAEGAKLECAQAAALSPDDSGLASGCGLKSGTKAQNPDGDQQKNAGGTKIETFKPGKGITEPVPLHKPEPPYSEKARQAKYQGTTVLSIVVSPEGTVDDARVVRPLGLGLDENALRTIRTWTFRPATRNGQPVSVRVMVEISFRLY